MTTHTLPDQLQVVTATTAPEQPDTATQADQTPDFDMAAKFICALAGGDACCFQVIDDRQQKRQTGAPIYGGLRRIWPQLCAANADGFGCFFTVNATNGPSRKAENITALRAVFVDLDGEPLPPSFPLHPSAVVESSPAKFHIYWFLRSGEQLERFSPTQKHLAAFYGGDKSVCDLPRLLRLPGLFHHKREPEMVMLHSADATVRYTLDEVLAAHPLPQSTTSPAKAPPPPAAPAQPTSTAFEQYRRWSECKHVAEGQRNATAFQIACEGVGRKFERAQVLEVVLDYCRRSGLPESEGRAVVNSAFTKPREGHPPTPLLSHMSLNAHVQQSETGGLLSLSALNAHPDPHPELHPDALHGLAGEVVNTLEPHTESDPVALLVQFLVAFGNCIGRVCYWQVGGDRHYSNLFAVLVGPSSRGRKGTSWSENQRLFEGVGGQWAVERVKGGLSSSEGLIWQVRDPILKQGGSKDDALDNGIEDKRLMLIESEFVNVLKQADRAGNTLSALVRCAWDRGNLESLTKNSPAKATGAHVSLIAHITRDELLRHLTTTECSNGLGNRFLWIATRRSKLLPDGGCLRDAELACLRGAVADAVEDAQARPRLMTRTPAASDLWREIYPELTAERDGLAAALTARGEAQTLRLAMLYAVLEGADAIDVQHLQAGLAVWRYAEQSTRMIFGSALGDQTADEIVGMLQRAAGGLTRTELRDAFGRHKSSGEVARALEVLRRNGLAHEVNEQTGGRPVERWLLGRADPATKAT